MSVQAATGPTGTGLVLSILDRWSGTRGDEVALTTVGGVRTWHEVRRQAARIAVLLAGRRLGPGSAVGLATGRSVHALEAILGVWASGATAVLLDERHPTDVLSFVVRDAGVDLLLAPRVEPTLLPLHVPVLPLADAPDTGSHPADTPPDFPPWPPSRPMEVGDADGVAYLVYTSGTSGDPKGVEVCSGGLDVLVRALLTLDLPPGGLSVNAVSPAFDGWLWCALLALTCGQGMALLDVTEATDGIGALIESCAPRTVSLTPSLLAACETGLDSAELVVVGGECCPVALAERFGPGRRMLNVYGPTEATVAATWADSAAGDDVRDIGRPLPGYHVHVLDDHGDDVGPGGSGELAIGGPGVARGYRNQPGLTAARFVPDPFDGGRLYLTGDLVARLPGGTLRYLGRRDDQVKVRGFRVELAGIDRAAEALPGVAQAAAYVTGDALGLAVLACPGTDLPPDDDLRCRLADTLPPHQVPALITRLPRLPTSATGKVDRRALALAAPDGGCGTRGRSHRGLSERELEVAAVWSEFLGSAVDDPDVSFFAMGGHSLLAARVVSALRRRTGADISLRTLLSEPTVAALARAIDATSVVV